MLPIELSIVGFAARTTGDGNAGGGGYWSGRFRPLGSLALSSLPNRLDRQVAESGRNGGVGPDIGTFTRVQPPWNGCRSAGC